MLRHPPFWPTSIALALAVSWVFLGFHSDNVPYGSEGFWLGACGVAAGSAVAVARYRSPFALRAYCAVVVIIGAIRSAAYLIGAGAGGPAAVWAIMSFTVALGYINVDRAINEGGS
jgi:hypothetical protein